jgi:hypothetical protein
MKLKSEPIDTRVHWALRACRYLSRTTHGRLGMGMLVASTVFGIAAFYLQIKLLGVLAVCMLGAAPLWLIPHVRIADDKERPVGWAE